MESVVKGAVSNFWNVRSGGKGVLGGKTLDGFVGLISDVIKQSGLSDVEIHTVRISEHSEQPFRYDPNTYFGLIRT
ncbi:PaeR7I family type II restriction endonuclease, partial [Vibrio parahaemolyticus]|nr:PaeR7I family type II restriction endonuclease [Vibrio parahaemolyticus]